MNKRMFALFLVVLICVLCACRNDSTSSAVIEGEYNQELADAINGADAPLIIEDALEQTEGNLSMEEDVDATVTSSSDSKFNSKEEKQEEKFEPSEPPAETTVPTPPASGTTEFEWYNALSGDEQMAFMESFESVPAFFDWYNAAKAEYDALHPEIEVGDDVIDLGDLVGGNG